MKNFLIDKTGIRPAIRLTAIIALGIAWKDADAVLKIYLPLLAIELEFWKLLERRLADSAEKLVARIGFAMPVPSNVKTSPLSRFLTPDRHKWANQDIDRPEAESGGEDPEWLALLTEDFPQEEDE